MHALTDLQLEEAENAVSESLKKMMSSGAQELLGENSRKKAEGMMSPEQAEAYRDYLAAEAYRSFAYKRRESKYISAALKEAQPVLEIEPGILDKDWFLLCTPNGTYDLRKGLDGLRDHSPNDFITRMTAYAPSDKGTELWQDALNTFFCGDKALIQYVQRVAGIVCVGQVFQEAMIIAYGDGRNGKSTFWNTLSRVMGSYSGNISADTLTMNCKRNVKPEMAETKGKRLMIAAELEEGTRLNTSMVKQLTSTDPVFAEKKYKDPFSFIPSHTLVLYTNHLPKVGAKDTGIWRRLIVIPFKAKIEGKSDIKNYTEYLCENAGEAIMKWMIEGAQQAIDLGFKFPFPKCVSDAIAAYKAENDWLGHFIEECCEVASDLTAKSGELYSAYRAYSAANGEYIRSTTDFYAALEADGFIRMRTRTGNMIRGLGAVEGYEEGGLDRLAPAFASAVADAEALGQKVFPGGDDVHQAAQALRCVFPKPDVDVDAAGFVDLRADLAEGADHLLHHLDVFPAAHGADHLRRGVGDRAVRLDRPLAPVGHGHLPVIQVCADVLCRRAEVPREGFGCASATETCGFNLDAESLCFHGVASFFASRGVCPAA